MAWYNEIDKVITVIGSAIAGSLLTTASALVAFRNKWSRSSTEMAEDKTQRTWYDDLLIRVKEAEAAEAAAAAMVHKLMIESKDDARTIAKQEATIESLKERNSSCEASTLRAEKWAIEADQQRLVLSQQLMFSHIRQRKLFTVVSKLDPNVAAEFVKENLDTEVKNVAETVKAELEANNRDPKSGSGN